MITADGAPGTPSQGTRARILEVARRIVIERGVGGLRMRELAREVGIREGSIYNHFPGREAIIKAIFAGIDEGLSPLGAILDVDATPPEELARLGGTIRSEGLAWFLRESGEHMIAGFARSPESFQLVRALFCERFHDDGARRAYDEVFLRDMAAVFNAIYATASEHDAVDEIVSAKSLVELSIAACERAIGASFADDGFARFAASLRDSLGAIGALAARQKLPRNDA